MPGKDRDSDDDPGGVVVAIQRAPIAEVRRDVQDVRADVVRLEVRVEDHDQHIGDLRERTALTEGRVEHLVDAYQRAANVVASQATADAEVRRAGAVAEIRERERQGKHRRTIQRELIFKAITVAMGLWAIVSSILAARC
ncbi:MAG TPA: hypothetical protein VJZ73_13245 [Methylomirabilota bacterium]|nr:hypothetical protein [Methylomirabilota bacterium]